MARRRFQWLEKSSIIRNRMVDRPHSKFKHVYAVVRIDTPVSTTDPENSFAVVKVLSSKTDADAEVNRLNSVNATKRCLYVSRITRMVD